MGTENQLELAAGACLAAAPAALPAGARSPDPNLARYFDETAHYWDRIYTGHKFVNWHLAERRQLVMDAVRSISGGRTLRILDLGSGSGVLTRDLLRMGHQVAALDCSEAMIRVLKDSLDSRSQGRFAGAALGSANATCFRSGAFDVILCVGVIQYQPRPEDIFDEIARLLKPGGHCIFTIPNQLSLHHVLDPWCALRYVHRILFRRRSPSLREAHRAALDHTAAGGDVYERRYFDREIPALVRTQRLAIREITPFGYGPLTLANRPLLPDRASIALSKGLVKLSRLEALSWVSRFVNRWVVVVEKAAAEQNRPSTGTGLAVN